MMLLRSASCHLRGFRSIWHCQLEIEDTCTAPAAHPELRSEGAGDVPPFPALSKDGPRVARVRCLSQEEKERVRNLSSYTEMPPAERKRQFAALDRRMRDVDTLPPGLLQQYQASFGNSERKFELLNLR